MDDVQCPKNIMMPLASNRHEDLPASRRAWNFVFLNLHPYTKHKLQLVVDQQCDICTPPLEPSGQDVKIGPHGRHDFKPDKLYFNAEFRYPSIGDRDPPMQKIFFTRDWWLSDLIGSQTYVGRKVQATSADDIWTCCIMIFTHYSLYDPPIIATSSVVGNSARRSCRGTPY